MKRFLLAHPKGLDEAALAEAHRVAVELLNKIATEPFALILARDEWEKNFANAGGWSDWVDRVVRGYDFSTGQPHFHGFIVGPGRKVGKATAEMVNLALAVRKPVEVLCEDGVLRTALGTTQLREGYRDFWVDT